MPNAALLLLLALVTARAATEGVQLSRDGRFALFRSDANLCLLDRATGATKLVPPPKGPSPFLGDATMSEDGGFVAFSHDADVYLRDIRANTTTPLSARAGGEMQSGPARFPVISEDGQRVVFNSFARDILSVAANQMPMFFWTDADGLDFLAASYERNAPRAGQVEDIWVAGETTLFISTHFLSGDRHVYAHRRGSDSLIWLSDVALKSVRPGRIPGWSKIHGLSRDGNVTLLMIGERGTTASTLIHYNLATGAGKIAGTQTTERPISEAALSGDGAVAARTQQNAVWFWNSNTGASEAILLPGSGPHSRLRLSDDARFLFFVSPAANVVPETPGGPRRLFRRDIGKRANQLITSDEVLEYFPNAAGAVVLFNTESLETFVWEAGEATRIEFSPPPELSLARSSDGLELRWSANGFALEWTASLGAEENWQAAAEQPAILGSEFVVRLEPSETRRFFRLRR